MMCVAAIYAQLELNGAVLVTANCGEPESGEPDRQCSNMVLIECAAGDIVRVTNRSDNCAMVGGNPHSTFSGLLIRVL